MKIRNDYLFTEEELDHGRRFVMHWDDFMTTASTLPHYEARARSLIKLRLGYLPPTEIVYLPYEPFLRSLFSEYDNGRLEGDVFVKEADDIIKKIRNDDLNKHGFIPGGAFSESDYHYYETHLSLFKSAARQRLSRILGYEPPVAHSLFAETHMRQLMQEDYYYDDLPPGDKVDHRSYTIYHYCWELIANGGEAANAFALIRIDEDLVWGKKHKNFL